jgi:hypothetical protein
MTAQMKNRKSLLNDDDGEDVTPSQLGIRVNQEYAERFEVGFTLKGQPQLRP